MAQDKSEWKIWFEKAPIDENTNEFSHVILYLRGFPYRHRDKGADTFIHKEEA